MVQWYFFLLKTMLENMKFLFWCSFLTSCTKLETIWKKFSNQKMAKIIWHFASKSVLFLCTNCLTKKILRADNFCNLILEILFYHGFTEPLVTNMLDYLWCAWKGTFGFNQKSFQSQLKNLLSTSISKMCW